MTDYNKLKVTELKELLKERGIASTGLSRKAQIVEALEVDDVKVSEKSEDVGTAQEDTTGFQESDGEDIADGDGDEGIEDVANEQDASHPVEVGDTRMGDQDTEAPVAQVETVQEEQGDGVRKVIDEEDATVPEIGSAQEDLPQAVNGEGDLVVGDQTQKEDSEMQIDVSSLPSSETLKRKRRSPTPELSDSSVKKKLKAAEDDLPKLPEDQVVEDAPVPMDENRSEASLSKEAFPYSTSDDVIRESPITSDLPPQPLESVEETRQGPHPDSMHDDILPDPSDTTLPPSVHPPTCSLYIRELMRPIQPQHLRSHLLDLATPEDTDADDVELSLFHVDNIKTHAFATFPSVSIARRVRSLLHEQVWPSESTRKPLWVDFVPDDEVKEWVVTEDESIGSKRDVRRWEVVYSTSEDGKVTAQLQEVTTPTGPRRQSSSAEHSGRLSFPNGRGAPQNAPLGHRNNGAPSQRPPTKPSPAAAPRRQSSDANFVSLDTRFPSTQTAKPKLYYLPVSTELANARLNALDAITSRTWDGGKVMSKGVSGRDAEIRRYTFEDGAKMVDNGADFGTFGRARGGGMGRGGYGGRGGRGGWR